MKKTNQTTLQKVEVVPESQDLTPQTDRELVLAMLARQQVLDAFAGFTLTQAVANMHRIKSSKAYKELGYTWEQFCLKAWNRSVDFCDRFISSFEEFGPAFFDVNSIVKVKADLWRAVNPKADEGMLTIGSQTIKIDKANQAEIQQLFNEQQKQLERAKDQVSEYKSEVTKSKKSRAAAEEKVEELTEALDSERNPKIWKEADEDHQALLKAQSHFEKAMLILRGSSQKDLKPDNQNRIVGLSEYMYRVIVQVADEVRGLYGVSNNAPELGTSLAMQNAPDGRDLMGEILAKRIK